jgi:molybdopterin-guanine dinucleotide biosynthesis protein A
VRIPAIVTAGDRGAARLVYGQSKAYLEVAGRPLVAHVVAMLQDVAEVSEVWVVGDAARLEEALGEPALRGQLAKPLHIVEQHDNLYENAWETFKLTLPGAGPKGRESSGDEVDAQVIYLSCDTPFATPQEIGSFIARGQDLDCDYALGLATDGSMRHYTEEQAGGQALDIAFFNVREGRVRQNNLHLARPARIHNRRYIQDMYRHRHMRKFGSMAALISKMLFRSGGIWIVFFYLIMHVAGLADRRGWRGSAKLIRSFVTLRHNELGVSRLLDCDFRLVVMDVGGCAVDVDTEADYDTVCARFDEWTAFQKEEAERLLGPGAAEPSAARAAATPREERG